MAQMTLPIRIETRHFILGQPILSTYLLRYGGGQWVKAEVVGGTFQGETFVYLIELEAKIHHARVYCGSCKDLTQRYRRHQRKYPLFRLTEQDVDGLNLPGLEGLVGRTYRRHHTFYQAIGRAIGTKAAHIHKFTIFHAAKKHNANGLVMAANRRGIAWHVARVFQANRDLEYALKRTKNLPRYVPNDDLPF